MIVKVELRNKSFTMIDILDSEIMNLTWEWSKIGGCGSFSFDLPRQYCNERALTGEFNIRIYQRNATTKAYDLAFQGLIEDKIPNFNGQDEIVSIQGHGYQAQLSRIQLINKTYTAMEASAIIKDILDNYIVPNTDIIYDIGDLTATGFTFDTLVLNTDALSAIQTIADTVGTREWGVDENRSLYFLERSSTTGLRFTVGKDIQSFNDDYTFKDIVNRVIVQGGDIAGVPFTPDSTADLYSDLASQLKYGRRDQVYQNSAIVTDTVAEQFAQSILLEKKNVVHTATATIFNSNSRIETTLPIPLLEIVSRGTLLGEKLLGTFLLSGKIQYQVNGAIYSIQNNDSELTIDLTLGFPRPAISETIAQLSYKLEQLRGASL